MVFRAAEQEVHKGELGAARQRPLWSRYVRRLLPQLAPERAGVPVGTGRHREGVQLCQIRGAQSAPLRGMFHRGIHFLVRTAPVAQG